MTFKPTISLDTEMIKYMLSRYNEFKCASNFKTFKLEYKIYFLKKQIQKNKDFDEFNSKKVDLLFKLLEFDMNKLIEIPLINRNMTLIESFERYLEISSLCFKGNKFKNNNNILTISLSDFHQLDTLINFLEEKDKILKELLDEKNYDLCKTSEGFELFCQFFNEQYEIFEHQINNDISENDIFPF